ncbi:class I SAM-dependent methyltransferase [Kitasatospora sp. NBC_01250]|uniref:class I SAM-dependent methyltransferase n=1 Tax=unclassified Kitasatospora TaxID=2633591 RepID=UPI002E0D181E|nr:MULTISPECIES: class I SAM-dependent methyltransferase [unclassified Kitasatospora]WSJ65218.1 class I SAM-dependent methyltransferase [Kitasatospora sp. NBC_01302]
MAVGTALADTWVRRWERQQERYAVDREERFTVIADVVESVTGGQQAPLVVDLGSGPGSLARRIAARLPQARILAVDVDPLLLELGRSHAPDAARYVEVLIGEDGWLAELELELDGPVDAVVSTTALHYPAPERLREIYRELAAVLRPGGVLVNGDHLAPADPALARLTAAVGRARAQRQGTGGGEDWGRWWAEVRLVPEFAELLAARELRPAPASGDGNGLSAREHEELLREAGFREVGPVWQCGDSCVLVAVR